MSQVNGGEDCQVQERLLLSILEIRDWCIRANAT